LDEEHGDEVSSLGTSLLDLQGTGGLSMKLSRQLFIGFRPKGLL
jgi:hypothetical protein